MLINLKKIRKEKGLTLKQLSMNTGISKSYLSDLENLYRINPSYKKVIEITKVLNTTIDKLEKGEEDSGLFKW